MNGYLPPPGRGELVWFNEEEDHGVLAAESGARITFAGAAFADSSPSSALANDASRVL